MTDKGVEKIISSLKDVGGQAAELVEMGWPYIVQQQYLIGILGIIGWLLSGIIFVVVLWKIDWERDGWQVIGAAAIFVFVLTTFFLFVEFIPHLLNPQYYALKSIMGMFR